MRNSDTTRKRGAYEEVLAGMQRGDIDILVGTQMIAKGHDFPEVTLVGVLLADVSMSFPDFRSSERTFQMLTQISGRAGRGSLPGKVILQTFSPENHAVCKASQHDFAGFMQEELSGREAMGYPPFGRMLLLRISGMREEAVREASDEIALELSQIAAGHGIRVLGPAPSPIARVKRRFNYQLLLISPPKFPFGEEFRRHLSLLREKVRKKGVRLEADVDPCQMMV